jgi:hypothetical protein
MEAGRQADRQMTDRQTDSCRHGVARQVRMQLQKMTDRQTDRQTDSCRRGVARQVRMQLQKTACEPAMLSYTTHT